MQYDPILYNRGIVDKLLCSQNLNVPTSHLRVSCGGCTHSSVLVRAYRPYLEHLPVTPYTRHYWLCFTPKEQLPLPHYPPPASSQHEQSSSVRMSHTHTAAPASSPNFQLIFNNALDAYKKRTKNDLLAHQLAAPLQACDSSNDVLLILQQQVEELNQSRNSNGRLTKWLDPTVNVLYAFSGALGEGVGLVCFMISDLRSTLMLILRYSPPRKSSLLESASSF
jgi:hypothetical protein